MDSWEKEENGAAWRNESGFDTSMALACAAVVLAIVNVSFSTGTGIGFGISIIGAFTAGSGAAFTAFAVLWDVLMLCAPVFALCGIAIRNGNPKKARSSMVVALCFCIAVIVLEIAFALFARSAGFECFSLVEILIIYAYAGDMDVVSQFVIYVGALVVFLIALKMRNGKVAIIGFSIIGVLAILLFFCGLLPFAYSVGGTVLFGQNIPRVTTYFVSELASVLCMWGAMAAYLVKATQKEKANDADEAR